MYPVLCLVGDGGLPIYIIGVQIVSKFNLPIAIIFFSEMMCLVVHIEVPPKETFTSASSHDILSLVKSVSIKALSSNALSSFQRNFELWIKPSPIFVECVFSAHENIQLSTLLR